MSLKFITEKGFKIRSLLFLILEISYGVSEKAKANCKDPSLRQKVTQTAKAEGVNENELLSIIAYESGCRYFAIAWNEPKKPETAKSKFFKSIEEAKAFAQSLIATKSYRVDVGIGQINNEAHIQPKSWSLDEILNPETALIRVAEILKERGWAHYHSSNNILAARWQKLALSALHHAVGNLDKGERNNEQRISSSNNLLVFNGLVSKTSEKNEKCPWIIYGRL